LFNSWGIETAFSAGTSEYASGFMDSVVTEYVNHRGGNIAEVFGTEAIRLAAGKIVVGQNLYNGIVEMANWLVDTYSLSNIASLIGYDGELTKAPPSTGGEQYKDYAYGTSCYLTEKGGYWVRVVTDIYGKVTEDWSGYYKVADYTPEGPTVTYNKNGAKVLYKYNFVPKNGGAVKSITQSVQGATFSSSTTMSIPSNYQDPEPLPQNKEWQGDYSGTPGFAEPPQDLPDFLSRVPIAVAENNLVVQGEIADTGGTPPTPTPNPSPSPSPAPYQGLSIAEKIALILGEITAIMFDTKGDTADQTYQDIGQEIEQTTEQIAESITEPITQTQTQTQQEIRDSTQTITQTITDTQTQTQEKLEDITQTITDTQTQTQEKLEDITQTIEDATSVPDQTSWDKVKKDLHGVFPFCIPWDIYGMLNAFNAEPRAPYFEYPFKIPRINLDYTLELDFKDFDPVAQTLRTVELIAFCVGLAILTSKVIRW